MSGNHKRKRRKWIRERRFRSTSALLYMLLYLKVLDVVKHRAIHDMTYRWDKR